MVVINNNLKAAFIHNPKCGGVNVRELLKNNYSFDEPICEIHINYENFFDNVENIHIDEDRDKHTIRKFGKYRFVSTHQEIPFGILENYFVFSFVRNPYEKLYSAYSYLKKSFRDGKIRKSYEKEEYLNDFNSFIKNYKNVNNISFFHAFITQCDQLLNHSNNININYIGRIEEFDSNLLDILCILNLKPCEELICNIYNNKRNNSSKEYDYDITEVYDEDTFNFVNDHFKIDFEVFSYERHHSFENFKKFYKKEKPQNSLFYNINFIMHEQKLFNNVFNKYKEIGELMMQSFYKSTNSFQTHKLLKSMNFPKSLVAEQNDILNNSRLNEFYNEMFKNNKETCSKWLVCNKCKFVSYNVISFNAHYYLCSKNEIANDFFCFSHKSFFNNNSEPEQNIQLIDKENFESTTNVWNVEVINHNNADEILDEAISFLKVKHEKKIPDNSMFLNTQQNDYNIYEKIVYDTAMFHFRRLNITFDDSKHFIEHWSFVKRKGNAKFHLDCDEAMKALSNNIQLVKRPFLSCLIYLDDNNDPTVITNVTDVMFKERTFNNIEFCFSYPKKLKHISFNGGNYYHGCHTDEDFNNNTRNVIAINLWNEKPLNYSLNNNSIKGVYNINNPLLSFDYIKEKERIVLDESSFKDSDIEDLIINSYKNVFNKINDQIEFIEKNTVFFKVINNSNLIKTNDEKYLQRFIINNFFDKQTCDYYIEESEKYAEKNNGWTLTRHSHYPTTDLPIKLIDSIYPHFVEAFNKIIDKIKIVYNMSIDNSKFIIKDAFVVKYEYNKQNSLELHKDDSSITVNLLLNDASEFKDGGTWFNDGLIYNLEKGDMLIHKGETFHKGLEITEGKRYLLVVFIKIYQ